MNAPLFHFEKRLDEESNGTNSGGRKIKEALSKKVLKFIGFTVDSVFDKISNKVSIENNIKY